MGLGRTEYVIVYRVRKKPERVINDSPSPYLSGVTITCEEHLKRGTLAVDVKNDEEARTLFKKQLVELRKTLNLLGDLLVGEPKLLKRLITEIELV